MESLERKSTKSVETGPEYWKERPNVPFDRGYFDLQFEFARALAQRNGRDLMEVIGSVAPAIDNHIMTQSPSGLRELRDGITEETAVDTAYENYLKACGFGDPQKAREPIPYHSGSRFGCFSHTYDASRRMAYVHFVNAEHGNPGPLAKENIAHRESELKDVLQNIKRSHPDAAFMMNRSWLFNVEAFRRLFPESYVNSRETDESPRLWLHSTVIWGQFLDSELKVKKEPADILLDRARTIAVTKDSISGLLEAPLMKPVYIEGPIQAFYDKYGVTS
jgi:hypothetical protein